MVMRGMLKSLCIRQKCLNFCARVNNFISVPILRGVKALVIQRHPLRYGSPFAIRFNKTTQTIDWQYIDVYKPEFARFQCRY